MVPKSKMLNFPQNPRWRPPAKNLLTSSKNFFQHGARPPILRSRKKIDDVIKFFKMHRQHCSKKPHETQKANFFIIIIKMSGFYCKQCDASYSSGYQLSKHIFTLKHQKNCGNDGYKKAQLIGARAYRMEQGAEPRCATVDLTNSSEIAEREYVLGLLIENRKLQKENSSKI